MISDKRIREIVSAVETPAVGMDEYRQIARESAEARTEQIIAFLEGGGAPEVWEVLIGALRRLPVKPRNGTE